MTMRERWQREREREADRLRQRRSDIEKQNSPITFSSINSVFTCVNAHVPKQIALILMAFGWCRCGGVAACRCVQHTFKSMRAV